MAGQKSCASKGSPSTSQIDIRCAERSFHLLFLRIFYLFSENAPFCVEKCKIFTLYFQGFTKNVKEKCKFLEKLAWRSVKIQVYSSAHRHGDARKAERLKRAVQSKAGRGSFQVYWLSEMLGWVERFATGYNLPGGASERIKRGKEKVVTRAVACAEMKPCGVSERGYTVLMNLKSSLVQQFLNIILWRVWFWLRTNAGGVDKTCKSNEVASVT